MAAALKKRPVSKPKKDEVSKQSRTTAQDLDQPWTPAGYTTFKILMSARLCAAWWSIITDCDETFNYWEPTHFLLFNKGFQTWEYSPTYAIRSYGYIWLHALPIKLYKKFLDTNKIVLFYLLRCILGFVCALCETYFYKGVCKHYGANTGRLTLWFLLFSAGMFISCSSYLPSSFSMYLTMLAMGTWFLKQYHLSILAIAASTIIGWPFAAALGIPIAWDILLRQKDIRTFVVWSFISLILFLLPLVQLDSFYYDKLVVAPLNILLYNVFSEHGPDLYGVEPFSFYFLNGFLNFNVIFLAALVCLPVAIIVRWVVRSSDTYIPMWLSLAPMYIWIAIFFTRPHKEERFLFPIYPFFALGGAIFLDHIQKLLSYLFPKRSAYHYTDHTNWVSVFSGALFTLLSVSRITAIYQGYHASMDIYVELNKMANDPKIHTLPADRPVNICVGKEWYRFPSSFFLPHDNWHLQFIKSEFKGQLPKAYESGPDATRIIPTHMNDLNLEEPTRYINISRCHYLIDLDLDQESPHEPRYSQMEDWKVLSSVKFLDPTRSHRLLRAFYIPFVSAKYCTYVNYNLLKTTRTKKSRGKSS
ncbi:alpha-1,2-mannosyltransferase ALG9-like [Haliotis asinina]|uniref:alpha-1,2-mannosyltransferase ALG9-like n=1 Tax=Haliotis asinina TaxID=109174 RepID=UPI00353214C4